MSRPKRRRLGQNYLVDPGVARRIASLTDPDVPRVLEIGPGRGSLTEPLTERFSRILALELDPSLVPSLQARFSGPDIEIRHADALTEPLEPLLAAEAPWQVASNLPYSVGTAILRRFLPRHDLFTRLVVMLQKEVVDRLVAEPSGKGHGLIALERAAYADARFAFDVPPDAFRPRPKVMSGVVVLDLVTPRHTAAELDAAFKLASHALTKPRKKMTNALAPLAGVPELEHAGIDPSVRPGTLDLEAWVLLGQATTKT